MASANVSARMKYLLDKMNSVSADVTLGTKLLAMDDVVAKGTFTTAGGDADESITSANVVSTDLVFVTLKTAGATPRTVLSAAAGSGAIAVVLSGDPSTDHVLQYLVIRPTPA